MMRLKKSLLVGFVFMTTIVKGTPQLSVSGYAALVKGLDEIGAMKESLEKSGSAIPELGSRADEICYKAMDQVPPQEQDYLHRLLDAQLKVLYEKQLRILRDVALAEFQGTIGSGCADEHERIFKSERAFCVAAVEASREHWSYESARRELRDSLFTVASSSSQVRAATLKSAQQRANYFTVLRKLVYELDDATNARLGLDSPIDAAIAFRFPETNINLSAALQKAKTNIQLSCVPDDSASILGPSGFNKPRVGPGDLALSYKTEIIPPNARTGFS
eukprot:CAMPEP_0197321384 /NCGR_PEP_ID=MMETSP0891-20130614/64835_1 /TAXON_ID=44058 ORGANISM="Aureoumbra lagunensis, Strain CCMP1510" /NCGR_SAMPLE_ID=MMETSP0891 /ASSEMBLY_ACC=CAM_ASM_000534 /LENGTH=275 /DNA_ID=CAMNT_0042813245 /DNA_START=766 /DNA_END=1593 /DNA_ORIENTATION=-